MTSIKKSLFLIVSQSALDVITSTLSGTNVTCVGFVSYTKSINLGIGLPSILYSVWTTDFKSRAS